MNHTFRSIALFLFLVIIFGTESAYGENRLFNDEHQTYFLCDTGFLSGTSFEIVYRSAGENRYLSELQWNFKPLFYAGFSLNYDLKEPAEKSGFFLGMGLKGAFPAETGSIEDRDWMLDSSDLTHYSFHENHTTAAVFFNLNAGYSLPVWKFILKFNINFDFLYFYWEARNGYFQYGPNNSAPFSPWDPSFPKEPVGGLGISYNQNWLLLNAGIGADFPIGGFTFYFCVYIGPAICIAIDEHYKTFPPATFIDTVFKGLYVKPKLGLWFSCNGYFSMGLSFMYNHITETRGNTVYKNYGEITGFYKNTGGAAFKAIEGNFSVKFRL